MLNFNTLRKEGSDFIVTDFQGNNEIDFNITPRFPQEEWCNVEAFKSANIRGYEPMTAKELETEQQQDEKFNDIHYYVEEKFDGTRALVYFLSQENDEGEEVGYCRVFSRRISKKTGFYVENTDSLPQIRETNKSELAGTILDGELFINGRPFKDVSSTLNCLWDKAIDRQIEKGLISLHAFDILFYKGVDLRKMPLERRKAYLSLAVEEANNKYIELVKYYQCGMFVETCVRDEIENRLSGVSYDDFRYSILKNEGSYPNLSERLLVSENGVLTPRAYYELIVATGGEGVILKPKNGKYLHKRGWEYSKVKKFLTREMIVIGFTDPTKEYTGKNLKNWCYWVDENDNRFLGEYYDSSYTPVTKNYYYNLVGNIRLGVLITKSDYDKIPKNKQGVLVSQFNKEYFLMEVCECAGFDDNMREYFTENRKKIIGSVVEVKANEIMKDSGRLRHPRYLRIRYDKEPERCTWIDHIGDKEVVK